MGDRISDASVHKATGRDWEAWFTLLDGWGASDMDHATIAARILEETDASGWWAQTVTVAYERALGRRHRGESARGWQCSVQRTLSMDPDAAWAAVLDHAWLPTEHIEEGMHLDLDAGQATVRAVRPGRLLRLWLPREAGHSTLEVQFTDKGGRTAVRFLHAGLADAGAKEAFRQRWRQVLDSLPS